MWKKVTQKLLLLLCIRKYLQRRWIRAVAVVGEAYILQKLSQKGRSCSEKLGIKDPVTDNIVCKNGAKKSHFTNFQTF